VLPQRVEIDEEEEQHTEHAEFDANRSAGPKDFVLWRQGPLQSAERVIVIAVAGDNKDDSSGEQPRETHAEAMPSLGVFTWQYGGAYACGYAHCFAICSFVFTENRL
jgi:hypothetical protein